MAGSGASRRCTTRVDRVGAGGVDQQRQLVERGLECVLVVGRDHADQDDPLPEGAVDERRRTRRTPERAAVGVGVGHVGIEFLGSVIVVAVTDILTSMSAMWTASPMSAIGLPTSTTTFPPGISTWTLSPTRPQRRARAPATAAPDPHASVTPAPRSQDETDRVRSGDDHEVHVDSAGHLGLDRRTLDRRVDAVQRFDVEHEVRVPDSPGTHVDAPNASAPGPGRGRR